MKEVPLTQGKFALVDDEDYERVMQFKWHYYKQKDREYATRTQNIGMRGDPDYKRITVWMHRFVLPHDMPQTDHRDRNGLNNQKSNLRPATVSQNNQNQRVQEHSTQFKGVHFKRDRSKYGAVITVSGRNKHLGYFNAPEDAARAYNAAALECFGEFARINTL